MSTILCLPILVVLIFYYFKFYRASEVVLRFPDQRYKYLVCNGNEALIVFMISTAWVGILPYLSLQLGILIALCILVFFQSNNRNIYSIPIYLYLIFLVYVVVGCLYGSTPSYGVRMLLKYSYPVLFAITCAKVVRDGSVMILSGLWGRLVGIIGMILLIFPLTWPIFFPILWDKAGYTTGLIFYMVFSLSLVYHSKEKRQNIIWTIGLILPCIIEVFRTDILGSGVAIIAFFLIKYKIKALPIAIATVLLGLCAIFYIPAVKEKMFFQPTQVEMEDWLNGNVDQNTVRTNYRTYAWEKAEDYFGEFDTTLGNGSGAVQNYMYNLAPGSMRSGQLHNDYMVMYYDNGVLGLILFLGSYLAIFVHCIYIYNTNKDPYIRIAAITAGSSVLGVAATMYTDNTVSYSMVTLAAAWGFYGMMLGLKYRQEHAYG